IRKVSRVKDAGVMGRYNDGVVDVLGREILGEDGDGKEMMEGNMEKWLNVDGMEVDGNEGMRGWLFDEVGKEVR
ncbi:hypothetical protein, partial [Paenibacillus sp. Y412MC10]|uniref:hypothetical protein n=1 Tax=Geobacillus sp. (strain Y412MC10) TaxID=481743 RepID=UPI00164239A2